MNKKISCGQCIFWEESDSECRRLSPLVVGSNAVMSQFPTTSVDDWCGEFKNNKGETAEYIMLNYG